MKTKTSKIKPVAIYVRIVSAILLAVLGWGVVCPPLVSSPTDAGLILGVILFVAVPIGIYFLVKPIFKHYKNKKK
jgi:hypothetical protein